MISNPDFSNSKKPSPNALKKTVSKKNIEAIYRLSPMQEGVLYHSLQSSITGVYFQQFSCTLTSLDNVGKWQESWSNCAEAHAIFRTLFAWENRDHPLQIVRERISLPWDILDWSALEKMQIGTQWASLLERDRDRGFDFNTAPLMRFTLVKIEPDCYRFLWSFHHILLDGWSQRTLFNEALARYRSSDIYQQTNADTPSYESFINWQVARDKNAEHVFWSAQLSGFTNVTNISDVSIDNIQTAEPNNSLSKSNRHHVVELMLPQQTVLQLKNAAKTERITLNTLVLGAWAKILATDCRVSDVVFGTTVSGRPFDLPGAEKIAGLFINTLPCRVKLNGTDSLANWLRNIQSEQVKCRAFEQTSLADIQRWSEVTKGSTLFESIIVFENLPAGDDGTTNASPAVSKVNYDEISHFPLAILIDPREGLKLIAVHQSKKIGIAKVNRLLAQLESVLSHFANSFNNPLKVKELQSIKDFSILSVAERKQVLHQWNQTEQDKPKFSCIHQFVEHWAEKTPEAIALISHDPRSGCKVQLNYQELNIRANKLAHYLIEKGVGPGYLIPILMERNISQGHDGVSIVDHNSEAVVAMLATLKSGAAYIPLDANYPKERVERIFNDIAHTNTVLLSHTSLSALIPINSNSCIYLDRDIEHIERCSSHNLKREITGDELAYIIYTSGSTGQPKGVMIEHKSLVNSTLARGYYYSEQPSAFLLLSSFATDSSVAGLYWALSTGAALTIAPHRLEQDIMALQQLISTSKISHLLCIPSLYYLLLEHCEPELLSDLKMVIVAGEVCSPALISLHQQTLKSVELHNEYGPSECTVWATAAPLHCWQPGSPVSIGTPIANTQAYVLDANHQLVPEGVIGELYLGGDNLARGYFNSPDKTQDVFINNLLGERSKQQSERLYKTGDLVRFDAQGSLEFIGRADNQIKLRGFRIEPEEIEQVLTSYSEISEAVVFLDDGTLLDEKSTQGQAESLSSEMAKLSPEECEKLLLEVELLPDDEPDNITYPAEQEFKA